MRILIAGMSNMLFEIVTEVLAQSPETIVVARVADRGSVPSQIRSAHTDAVMMQTAASQDASDVWRLLYQFPTLKVVTIAGDGRGGFVHELLQSTRALAELSGETLRLALRGQTGGTMH